MRIVIQCAAQKNKDAGFWTGADGKKVCFVADPAKAAPSQYIRYARPDDVALPGTSWRSLIRNYNKPPVRNPYNLFPAYRLYRNQIYRALVNQFGSSNVYILSAGWGLIRSDFLTPYYDITFSAAAEALNRRHKSDSYLDFCMLEDDGAPVTFFGGKDYLPLFCSLTVNFKGCRTVFYNSASRPSAPSCRARRFETATRTNWHYECAKAFMAGEIK